MRMKNAMYQTEIELAIALKAAEVGTWALDLATQRVRCSAITDALFELPPSDEQREADEYFGRIHPDDLERVVEAIRATVMDGAEHRVEYRVVRRNGGVRWLSSRGEVFRDEAGGGARLVGALLDVTGRKRDEERLELLAAVGTLLTDQLDGESLPQRVVELLVPGLADRAVLYVRDADGAARAVAWRSVDEAEAGRLEELLACPLDARAQLPIHRVLEGGEPLLLRAADVQAVLAGAAGSELGSSLAALASHEALVVPLVARGRTVGALSCVVGAGRSYDERDRELALDVAGRAALVLDNARLYKEAQQAVRSRDNFITVASHDLRSPLTVLLGQAQMLERRAAEDHLSARGVRAVQSIREQSTRLDRMITALLDLSRIQTGRLTLDLAPLDLGALVARVAAVLQPGLTRHVITVVGPDQPLVISGDEVRLEQVFQNLIGNAVKYSPAGGTVLVRVQAEGELAVVEVADQGLGMAEDVLPLIFDQFYRGPNAEARNASGLGVGLYIVREIVGLHHGSVSVTSEEGVGSRFIVRLPAHKTTASSDG
jgi:signal transduction histidine kinase